jgi:pimeloyl-ACP methyl ester carboxylesterase
MSPGPGMRNIVLVHGAFVDGSTWRAVYGLLAGDGFAVVQNPTLSLSGDVAATRQVIDAQDGPVVLVGHSYGGAVITEAGVHDKVAALVYIAAFAPDKGESVRALGGIPTRRDRRSSQCRRGFGAKTERNSTTRSVLTCPPKTPCSWPTLRSRGGWTPWRGRSSIRPGEASQPGTSSRRRIA